MNMADFPLAKKGIDENLCSKRQIKMAFCNMNGEKRHDEKKEKKTTHTLIATGRAEKNNKVNVLQQQ